MKILIILLCTLIIQSCQISDFAKKDKHSLYLNTIIPANSSLDISTQNTKSFSFDTIIKSKGEIKLNINNQDIVMDIGHKYTFDVKDGQKVKFINPSNHSNTISIRIYNHSSKIIKNIEKLKHD